jgi:hypothetical protein
MLLGGYAVCLCFMCSADVLRQGHVEVVDLSELHLAATVGHALAVEVSSTRPCEPDGAGSHASAIVQEALVLARHTGSSATGDRVVLTLLTVATARTSDSWIAQHGIRDVLCAEHCRRG